MTGFTWEPSEPARFALNTMARAGMFGLEALLEAAMRHEAEVEHVRHVAGLVLNPHEMSDLASSTGFSADDLERMGIALLGEPVREERSGVTPAGMTWRSRA